MSPASYNIFGVTGGIGYSFLSELVNYPGMQVAGFYCKNEVMANKIKMEYPFIKLTKADLTSCSFSAIEVPNYAGLLYVVGQPHFSQDVFSFTEDELLRQMHLNVLSLMKIIKKQLHYNPVHLRRVVIIGSIIPEEVKSIYHLTKALQDNTLTMLSCYLRQHNIAVSIVRTGWVNTRMYHSYLDVTKSVYKTCVAPEIIARACLKEFNSDKSYNDITISL